MAGKSLMWRFASHDPSLDPLRSRSVHGKRGAWA